MHGEDAHLRQVIVHRVENGLLDFTCVMRPHNDHLALLKRLKYRAGRVQPQLLVVVQFESASVDDRPTLLEPVKLARLSIDEQRLGEQAMPCFLGDHRNTKPVGRVRPGEAIESKQLFLP